MQQDPDPTAEFEFCFEDESNHQTDNEFDTLVGLLEELLISEDFELIQNEFIREKCKEFTEDENKPEHMLMFKEYQRTLESFIEESLKKQAPQFTMKSFLQKISENSQHIDEQILETLLSFSDYQLFKEIMLEQKIRVLEEERTIKKKTNKANQKGKQAANNNIFAGDHKVLQDLIITNQKPAQQQKQKQHQEEEIEEGDLRPDLFLCVRHLPTPRITKKQQ